MGSLQTIFLRPRELHRARGFAGGSSGRSASEPNCANCGPADGEPNGGSARGKRVMGSRADDDADAAAAADAFQIVIDLHDDDARHGALASASDIDLLEPIYGQATQHGIAHDMYARFAVTHPLEFDHLFTGTSDKLDRLGQQSRRQWCPRARSSEWVRPDRMFDRMLTALSKRPQQSRDVSIQISIVEKVVLLGHLHARRGIRPSLVEPMGKALMYATRKKFGARFGPAEQDAAHRFFSTIARYFILGLQHASETCHLIHPNLARGDDNRDDVDISTIAPAWYLYTPKLG